MKSSVRDHVVESIQIKQTILESDELLGLIQNLDEDTANVLQNGGQLLFAANGGSFADSQHIAAEFGSKLRIDRQPLPAIALGTNSSSLSAIGND